MDEGTTKPELAGVAATALGIALARAEESRRPDRLFEDPLARVFLDQAGGGARVFAGAAGAGSDAWAFLRHTVAIRTRFFDQELAAAASDGCCQVVLLAAGLDARALRLDWPAGTRVFEVDQPHLMAFKDRALRAAGIAVPAARKAVAVDLRDDWSGALLAAGFRASEPTAWLVEGLLPALTPEISDRLLGELTRLSAPGSRLALDHLPQVEAMLAVLDAIDPALRALWNGGPTEPIEAWLGRHGWSAAVRTTSDVASRFGRAGTPSAGREAPDALLVAARR